MLPPTELAEVVVGSLLLTLGLGSIAVARARRPPDSTPFWFGAFTALYGVRLAGNPRLIHALVSIPSLTWDYLDIEAETATARSSATRASPS